MEYGAAFRQPVKVNPMDAAHLLTRFAEFQPIMEEMKIKANDVQVVDDESAAACAEMAGQAETLKKEIENRRKTIIEPYRVVVDAVNGCVKTIRDQIDQISYSLKNKAQAHLSEKKRIQREAEEKARAEAAKVQAEQEAKRREQERAAAKAAEEGRPAPPVAEVVIPVSIAAPIAQTKIKTAYGSMDTKQIDAWKITDWKDLPDAAFASLETDSHDAVTGKKNSGWPHVWIGKQIAAGMSEIPGVNVFKMDVVKTRTR